MATSSQARLVALLHAVIVTLTLAILFASQSEPEPFRASQTPIAFFRALLR